MIEGIEVARQRIGVITDDRRRELIAGSAYHSGIFRQTLDKSQLLFLEFQRFRYSGIPEFRTGFSQDRLY